MVSNLQLNIGQFAGAGQPALTFLDARLVWLHAFLRENSLEHIRPGTRAEVVLDVLPGRVLPARVESVGWGVGEGDVDTTTGLPKTRQGSGGWFAPAQRFPVQLAFETAGEPPRGVRYNARASVILYTGEHPVANALAWLWIRLIAVTDLCLLRRHGTGRRCGLPLPRRWRWSGERWLGSRCPGSRPCLPHRFSSACPGRRGSARQRRWSR